MTCLAGETRYIGTPLENEMGIHCTKQIQEWRTRLRPKNDARLENEVRKAHVITQRKYCPSLKWFHWSPRKQSFREASLFLVAMPGAPVAFLLLVAMPFVPSSVLYPNVLGGRACVLLGEDSEVAFGSGDAGAACRERDKHLPGMDPRMREENTVLPLKTQ